MKYFVISTLLFLSTVFPSFANAFVSPSWSPKSPSAIQRGRSQDIKMEDFGLGIGEDPSANTPSQILGEARYKKFVGSYKENSLLLGGQPNQPNPRDYDIIDRVSETRLLSLTAESGLLSALEAKGLTLSDFEKLLPLIDELNLLPLAKENKQFILNTLAPLVVEQSSTAIPLAVSLLKTDPSFFLTVATGAIGAEGALIYFSQNTLIDFVGGLVLLPLAIASYTAGNLLKKGLNVDLLASAAKSVVDSPSSAVNSKPSKVTVNVSSPQKNQASKPSIRVASSTKGNDASRPKVTLSTTNTDSPKLTKIDNAVKTQLSKTSKPKKAFNFKAIKPKQSGASNWSTKN